MRDDMVEIQGSCMVDVRKMPAARKRPAIPASDKPDKKAKVAPPEVGRVGCSPLLRRTAFLSPHPHALAHALHALPSTPSARHTHL